ncbi:hypothetical protein BDV29DRAFT_166698 [Aspergillus leporis]|uniref:Uncharacterized protein n=1 Tax=Aspergillus leporis TaxID=41062 RepID=A0A5N5XDI2_9EURO|nr:hypothetical protein BDV29DRAFT_166698 [Aspergillus leporis]
MLTTLSGYYCTIGPPHPPVHGFSDGENMTSCRHFQWTCQKSNRFCKSLGLSASFRRFQDWHYALLYLILAFSSLWKDLLHCNTVLILNRWPGSYS